MSREELQSASEKVFSEIKVVRDEVDFLEESTRQQAQSSLWHKHRVGRITASTFHQVLKASTTPPPPSLIKKTLE